MKKLILTILISCYAITCIAEQYNAVYPATGKKYDYIGDFSSKDWAMVRKNGKCGFIDKAGNEVIPLTFDNFGNKGWWKSDLYMSACRGNKWGVINQQGELLIPIIYDKISQNIYKDSPIWAVKDGKQGFIDINGHILVPFEYEVLEHDFYNGHPAYAKKNGLYGFIDEQNKVVVPFKYSATSGFHWDGPYAPVCLNGKYGYIDTSGNEVIPFQYEFANGFHQGFAAVLKNGKVGYIDTTGTIVIPCSYDSIYTTDGNGIKMLDCDFMGGIARVKSNGKWGAINKKGTLIAPTIYDHWNHHNSEGTIDMSVNGQTHYFDCLGNKYESGAERGKSLDWVKANAGYRSSQYEIGRRYYKGSNGYTQDYAQAHYWFSKSAEQGYKDAQLNMGHLYYYGYGVDESYSKAHEWYAKAADQGQRIAQYYMGWMAEHGQGTTKNINDAKYWYSCSAAQGYEKAKTQLDKLGGDPIVSPQPIPYPAPAPTPKKNLATLTWVNFQSNSVQKNYTYKVGVKSDSKIEEVRVYVNGIQDRGIAPVLNDGFDMTINRSTTLAEGRNIIKVFVRNSGGETYSERAVVYAGGKAVNNTDIQQRRIALVMGNSKYKDADKCLRNPYNDATDLAAKLESLGFKVIRSLDQTLQGMELAINDFGRQVRNYDVALFYYAGHGMRCDGFNYLVPTDASLPDESYVKYKCINANIVLDVMERAQCPMKIVILDACRNNPFARGWSRGLESEGLGIMTAPKGTFVAFSTAPGDVAQDGIGRNSPYTTALLQALDVPGLSLTEVFQEVLEKVATSTNERQTPWYSNSFRGKFYFNQK